MGGLQSFKVVDHNTESPGSYPDWAKKISEGLCKYSHRLGSSPVKTKRLIVVSAWMAA